MNAEQFWPGGSGTLAGAWTCPTCHGTFLGSHSHDQQPTLVFADPMAAGRIASALERIAAATERQEVRTK